MKSCLTIVLLSALSIVTYAQSEREAPLAQMSAASINVGEKVNVSSNRPDRLHWEPIIAADPGNPKNLLACWIDGEQGSKPESFVAVYSSVTGGLRWRKALEIVDPNRKPTVDPSCAFGPSSVAYATALIPGNPMYKSLDSGRTWFAFGEFQTSADREYITVDNTKSSHRGRVYLHYEYFARWIDGHGFSKGIDLWRSADSGNKFSGPARLASNSGSSLFIGNGTVLPDGTFTAIAQEGRRVFVVQSRGDTYPIEFSDVATVDEGNANLINTACLPLPKIAADISSGPFKNHVYAVWSDDRDIIFSHSSDKGKTWSPARAVSDNKADGRNSCTPEIAVNKDGIVGVLWYERVSCPKIGSSEDDIYYETRFSASLDGGGTFLPSVKLAKKITPKRFRIGESIGLAAGADGKFHALWIENHTGNPQVYYAPITVAASNIVGRDNRNQFNDDAQTAQRHP